jgi:hypothetical protein
MSWRLAKGERSSRVWKKKKRGGGSVRNFVSSYVCKNQAWKECVQESSIERVCVRIRHEKNLCSKYLLQSLWTFVLISCSSQIHRWICVKIESVLVWKV